MTVRPAPRISGAGVGVGPGVAVSSGVPSGRAVGVGSASKVGVGSGVATRAGTPIFVRDVASVEIGAMPREGAVTRDAKGEALSATVVILKGANSRAVIDEVTARLDEVRKLLPAGVQIRTFYNQGEVVDHTTRTVFRNLLEGGLLVTLILFLFLRNVRASLITSSVRPVAK